MQEGPSSGNRELYKEAVLDQNSVNADPFIQFSAWFRDAVDSGVPEPEAMFLASADKKGIPSGRMVLMKGFDQGGFVFFTNYDSRKGTEIDVNPFAALVFHWKEILRQVRIEGKVQRVAGAESDEYFASRPLESKISAIASVQSRVIPDRKSLEEKFEEVRRGAGTDPARPAYWGGYRIAPSVFEFWQSRPYRLHDRIRYRLEDGSWVIERLSP